MRAVSIWNAAGAMLLFMVFMVVWYASLHFPDPGLDIEITLFVLVGPVLLFVDRRVCRATKYGVFLVSFLWFLYWGFLAIVFFSTLSFSFYFSGNKTTGDGMNWMPVVYTLTALTLFFAGVALANLARFFRSFRTARQKQ